MPDSPTPTRPPFYLIDGHAQIYRAYFSPFRDLTSPAGEPVKATFVFTQMLLNLVEHKRPHYLAMVIDEGGDETVFRRDLYPAYKANRPPRPDDFNPQEARILQIVRDAGIPIFGKPAFEADDVIATIAKRLEGRGFDVVLVSKDKDLRQLLDDHVAMYDVHADTYTTPASMLADLGYTPAQAVEVQTLMGDKVDNVPGIPGVGEGTASKLIAKYHTVDNVLAHVAELTPKLRENLIAHQGTLPLARTLVTLRTDVEIDFDPEACRFTSLDTPALRSHLAELGFTSLLRRLGGPTTSMPAPRDSGGGGGGAVAGGMTDLFGNPVAVTPHPRSTAGRQAAPPAPIPAAVDGAPAVSTGDGLDYRLVNTPALFADFLTQLSAQTRFAFDTETDALGAMSSNLVGLAFSWAHGTGWYVPVRGPAAETFLPPSVVLPALRPVLENPAIAKVGHNIKYDLLVLRQAGVALRGIVLDSMIAAFLLDASRLTYGIDRLALDLLRFRKVPTSDLIGSGKSAISMTAVPLDRVARYASEDADIALRLADLFSPQLDAIPALRSLADTVETPLIDVLADMEQAGITVDPAVLREQSGVLATRIDELRARVLTAAGVDFNPDSPRQLAEVLFNRLGLKVVKRTKTGPSTDVEVLERLAAEHPVPALILEYRSLVKLKNTYLDNLEQEINPTTGRIHAHFNQIGAATGRLSCSDPNLQNIPIRTDEGRRIRLAFVPAAAVPPNVLLTADYSQIELRILAHYTLEPALVAAFDNDEDIHRAVAAEVFGVPLDQVTRDQRGQAKTINFGIIYGVTAHGLQRRIDGMNFAAADELIRNYNRRFPGIKTFMDQCVEHARTHGYVQTLLGRRRPLPDINSGTFTMRNAAERMAINSVVQGSAADLIKLAMLRVRDRLARDARPSRMLLQVHDELVFETPASAADSDAAAIREEMTSAMTLRVPLKVDVGWGKNWQEVK